MGETVRWGILGAGPMAEAFVRGLDVLPRASAVAVASRSESRAGEFARRMGIAETFGSVDELVASSAVDIVYVATTNDLHRDHMLRALEAGKHVLCEKPFATDAREAREVAERARSQGLFCMEAMWSRFLPAMARVRELAEGGAIGDVQMLAAQMGYPYVVEPEGRLWKPELGGGVLLDLGVYLVSLALDLLGPVEEVVGSASTAQTGVDDRVGLVLRHTGGKIATLSASLTCATSNEALLSGTGGSILLARPFYRPERLVVRTATPARPGAGGGGGRLATLKAQPVLRTIARQVDPVLGLVRGNRRHLAVPHVGNGYQYQAAEAMRCVAAGVTESPVMPLSQSIAILDVLDEVRRQWPERAR